MGLKYLHICHVCDTAFDSEENIPKGQAVCIHCQMLPEVNDGHYHVDAPTGISPGGHRMIITTPQTEDEEKIIEVIDSGMTGGHVKGTANHSASHPQRHHIFKKKVCKKCKKIFEPTAGNDMHCSSCKSLTVIKTRQARNYVKREEVPHTGRGRPVKKIDRVALEKLADGLISEATGKQSNRITEPYTPGLAMAKQIRHDEQLPGVWVRYAESGLTFDNRNYVMSRNLISGEVAVDLWNPRERYLSDSSAANWIHGPSLAQGNDTCGCTPPPDVS